MNALHETERTLENLERIGGYARNSIRRAAAFALRLHAEEVAPEHLLCSLFEDEDCAATRTVLHAFADPETLSIELMALAPGILVIGSKRSLPFSPLGVRALEQARVVAAERGASTISPAHLAWAAAAELDTEQRDSLSSIGFIPTPEDSPRNEPADASPLDGDGPVLKYLDNESRRALSAACKKAHRLGRRSISPAHLVMSALEFTEAQCFGTTAQRVSIALHGQDEDTSPPQNRALPPDAALGDLLARLPDAADTHALLAHLVHNGSAEIQSLLLGQKITRELLAHTAGAFEDPEQP